MELFRSGSVSQQSTGSHFPFEVAYIVTNRLGSTSLYKQNKKVSVFSEDKLTLSKRSKLTQRKVSIFALK